MKKLSIISVVLLASILAGCKEKTQQHTQEEKPLVKVMPSVKQEVEQQVSFTGIIDPYKENVITPASPMRIDRILVEVGDRVNQGQLLVNMDATAYAQAAVQLAQLETDYQRMNTVYEANGISKQQLDAHKAQLDVSRAQVANLLTNTELRSPIQGVVTARNYDPGDMYSGAVGILTVMQMDRLKVVVNISEQYFPVVKVGMPADITLDLYPEDKFYGKVSLVYPAVDPGTRTFAAEITIPNGNLKLRPGMFSRVALNFGLAERVMIPDLAVQKQVGSNERYVFTETGGTVKRVTVELGRQLGDRFEVLSGVSEGENVVTAGFLRIMDGTEVRLGE